MDINISSTGDLHLGHSRVPTQSIIERMYKYLFPQLEKTDLLCINGDVFHSVLTMAASDSKLAIAFFIVLFNECQKHNVTVRFLRGTSTHDRTQIETLMKMYEKFGYTNDVKYFDTLTIEYIEHLKVRMLYIPEDLPYNSAQEILEDAKDMFDKAGWDACDLVMFHGYFEHMLPPGIPRQPKITFKSSYFDDLVKKDGYVLCNHVHSKSSYGKILYSGSFDRLAHGEEESKGFFYINGEPHFIENKDATPFYTIDLSKEEDKDKIIKLFKQKAKKKFKPDVHGNIRFIHPSIEMRQIIGKISSLHFPNLRYTHKSNVKRDLEKISDEFLSIDETNEVVVTEENLSGLVHAFLTEKNVVDMEMEEIEMLLNLNRKGQKVG